LLTNRYKIFLDKGEKPQWYSLFYSEEKKGFNRADYILSIQDSEKIKIKSMIHSNKKVITLGHPLPLHRKEISKTVRNLIFVASHNYINIKCINEFITNIFPNITALHPEIKLLLAGSISDMKQKIVKTENIEYLGRYNHVNSIYNIADIAINPINFGTGLKIKIIEALSCGMPSISYKQSMDGLQDINTIEFCEVANDENDFKNKLINLIQNYDHRNKLSENAYSFMEDYNYRATKDFLTIFK